MQQIDTSRNLFITIFEIHLNVELSNYNYGDVCVSALGDILFLT
jgi:hypothetical protein